MLYINRKADETKEDGINAFLEGAPGWRITNHKRSEDITEEAGKHLKMFLISNFRRVLNAVCFLLGNSPASEFYMPTFRNTLSLPSS